MRELYYVAYLQALNEVNQNGLDHLGPEGFLGLDI